MPHYTGPMALIAALALSPVPAMAQKGAAQAGGKKLYCWDEAGQRVCADTLPAHLAGVAREEISARSGMRTAEVQRALTDEERAALAEEEARQRSQALAEETRRRTEQALLVTFQDEDDLRRVFNDRVTLVDNSVQTARYNVASLRDGLVTLLRTAAERELSGKPVAEKLAADIRQRHTQLLYHQLLQRSFERQRTSLDEEIETTLQRYRALKSAPAGRSAAPQAVSR